MLKWKNLECKQKNHSYDRKVEKIFHKVNLQSGFATKNDTSEYNVEKFIESIASNSVIFTTHEKVFITLLMHWETTFNKILGLQQSQKTTENFWPHFFEDSNLVKLQKMYEK